MGNRAGDGLGHAAGRFFWSLIVSMALLATQGAFADSNRAFRLLEKGDYEKLSEYLDKSIEKDSINPGARYVYSLLYLTPQYRQYSIDTAYAYILDAIADYALIDEKETERLKKLGIHAVSLQDQKSTVEARAFARAKQEHMISGYAYFLDRFSGAAEVDSAVVLRNGLAFEQARARDTYEAYREFMRKYPDAAQVPEAQKRYNALLYNTHTDDQRLDSYMRFVKNNPGSPFRAEAEENIFEIITADNAIESYMRFLDEYPDSPVAGRCYDFLYHRYKHTASAEAFLNRFGSRQISDSLRRIARADAGYVIPIFEMGQYGFMRDNGAKLIDFKYSDIGEKYLCGYVTSDFLEVWNEARHLLISRMGDVIMEGGFEDVADIGGGLLKIEHAGFYGLYHKSGRPLMEFKYQDLGLVGHAFIKYQFNGKWGLRSLSGRELLPAAYDNIFAEGDFIVIECDGLYDVQNAANLSRVANHENITINCQYDDYELIDEHHMLLFAGEMEAVIDQSLAERIPLARQKIYSLFSGWYVEKDGTYRIYDQVFYLVSPLQFQYLEHKGPKMALKYGDQWAVYNAQGTFPVNFPYDSVQLLSDEIAILFRDDEIYASFSSDTLVDISDAEELKLLSDFSMTEEEGPRTAYLLLRTGRNTYKAYNADGLPVLSGRYTSVEALGREYLLVQRSGKKGLYHKSGEAVLKTQYAAIGNYNDGYVSTLLNGRFGIYNYNRDLLLSAKYEKRLQPYGRDYFIGVRNNKSAIIDLENDNVTGFVFDQIEYWNDSSALVLRDDRWSVHDIGAGETAYDEIDEYRILHETPDEKLLMITRKGKVGILSSLHGEVIGPTFNDIVNVGDADNPVYFAEKYIPEAEFYVVIYYDSRGGILRKQVFNREEYDNIYCG